MILDSGREIACDIADFCLGGLFLKFSIPEKGREWLTGQEGSLLRIQFSTPQSLGPQAFMFAARLVRHSESGVGVAFEETPVPALLALNKVAAALHSQKASVRPYGGVDSYKLRTACEAHLKRAVAESFEKFHELIGSRLEGAASVSKNVPEQQELLESLQQIRTAIGAVEQECIGLLLDRLAAPVGDLSSGGHGSGDPQAGESVDFEDWISITTVSNKLADRFSVELEMLDRRLQQVYGPALDDGDNPFAPATILTVIKGIFVGLSLPLAARLIIDATLHDAFEEPLEALYRDLLNVLPAVEGEGQPATPDDGLGEPCPSIAQAPATLGSVASTLMGFARVGEGETQYSVSLPASVLNVLTQLIDSGKIPAARKDQATLSANVFSKLINAIGAEKSVPADVLPQLMELEDALLRLALLDPAYLNDPAHPAHAVLNAMDRLSLVCSDDGRIEDQRILQRITEWVGRIRSEAEKSPSVFEGVRAQIENTLRPLMKQRSARIARLQAALEGWQKTGQSNRRVLAQLEQRVAGRQVPDIVFDLFTVGWRNYLIRVMLRNGEGSEEEALAWETIDKLLDWLGAEPSEKPSYQAIQLLLRDVDARLKLVCAERDVQDRLIERLTKLLLKQEASSYQTVAGILPGQNDGADDAEAGVGDDDPLDAFRVGDWFGFEGTPIPLILIWIGDDPASYVFCNYKGVKKLELSRGDFLQRIRSGRARLAENLELPLMDRSFSSTIQRIHQDLLSQTAVDEKTGLTQQREFMRQAAARLLNRSAVKPDAADCKLMMGVLDIESLRVLRPRLGAEGYSELMRALASRLEAVLESGLLAHSSEYTFAFMLPVTSMDQMQGTGEKIISEINRFSFKWDGGVYTLSANIGLVCSGASRNPEDLYNRADEACVEAKHKGRNQIVARQTEDDGNDGHSWLDEWSAIVSELLEGEHLFLRCQPIFRTLGDSGTPSHYEVLLGVKPSWDKPLNTGEMMAAVEQLRRATEIDQWVIREVFAWMRAHSAGLERINGLSVNLSAQSINSRSFLDFLSAEMEQGRIRGDKLIFEITESAAIDSFAHAERFIRQMRRHGCRFALDDFGVGFSSFSYLKNLKVDYLKIDGSFVRNMSQNDVDVALVSSMHETSRFLGLETVAEVVENEETLNILKRIGVNYVQGYYTGRPLPLDRLAI